MMALMSGLLASGSHPKAPSTPVFEKSSRLYEAFERHCEERVARRSNPERMDP